MSVQWLPTRSAALLKETASGFGNMLCQSIHVSRRLKTELGGSSLAVRPEDAEGVPYLPLGALLRETSLGSVLSRGPVWALQPHQAGGFHGSFPDPEDSGSGY